MYFDSLHAALTMDGHGVYVWLAYGVTMGVIAAAILVPQRRRRRLLQRLAAEQRRSAGAGIDGGN